MLKYRFKILTIVILFILSGIPEYGVLVSPIRLRTDDEFLRDRCRYYGLSYRKMRAVRKRESRDKPNCIERKNGRVISYGYFQLSPDTVRDYCKKNGIEVPTDIPTAAKHPHWNQEIACYTIASYWRNTLNWRKAISAHNLGMTGLREYCNRTGKRYYSPYVDAVEKIEKTLDKIPE